MMDLEEGPVEWPFLKGGGGGGPAGVREDEEDETGEGEGGGRGFTRPCCSETPVLCPRYGGGGGASLPPLRELEGGN